MEISTESFDMENNNEHSFINIALKKLSIKVIKYLRLRE